MSGIRTIKEEGGKFLQITAPISPGSSGGPLFNMAGEVVGISTLYLKGGENLNFAIPVNDAKALLSTGSKVQDSPVETKAAEAEAHAEAAPSPSMSPSIARAYYKQLYDARGFKEPDTFVCFNDDPSLPWFFTFQDTVYDERYMNAVKAIIKNPQDDATWQTKESIAASRPIVHFITDDSLSTMDVAFGAGTETYLRSGGKLLTYTPYYKGVKEGESYFRANQAAVFGVDEHFTLSIEPTTLRWIERIDPGGTVASVVLSGMCENIPSYYKQSNKGKAMRYTTETPDSARTKPPAAK